MLRVFTSRRCLTHLPPAGFPEVPARLSRVVDHLRSAGRDVAEVDAHEAAPAILTAVHPEHYVERFRRSVERGDGLFDSADNPLMAATWAASWAAIETALAAADWVAGHAGTTGFAAVRPPGHHAEMDRAMGFCYFNNVAVAAEYLLRRHGCGRVAIFDFDVHHGNGTQHIFERRADVLYVSTHQYPFYPGTGAASERGIGEGEGFTLNLPLAAGTDDGGYERVLEAAVLPALRRFDPDVLLVSAGFDAWRQDPLGAMAVSEAGFAAWGRRLGELAAEVTGGRALVLLEGGYDLTALPRLVDAHLGALAGEATAADPFAPARAGEATAD